MKLVNSLGTIPAGRTARVSSSGTWTASSATNTSTTTSTVSVTTTIVLTSTVTVASTTTVVSEKTTQTTVTTALSTGSVPYDISTVVLGGLLAVALAALLLSRRKPI
ncbi:MAG: hypothetical protein OK452_05215 [Thaumarchaeota archaeon]|nr:hypothetical protein [Nitrososphaerota archaeon]